MHFFRCIFVVSSVLATTAPLSESGVFVDDNSEKSGPGSSSGTGRESSEDSALVAELAASSTAASSGGRCIESDVNIWRYNMEFTDRHRHCSRTRFGDGPKTSACILKKFTELTHACATCFGDVTECMRSECWASCFLDDTSESCMVCFNTKCQDGFHGCIGTDLLARDPSNIPLRPGQVVGEAGAAAPATTTTTTTAGPSFAVRARAKPKSTTTELPPSSF